MNVSDASRAPDSSVRKATPSDITERTARSGAVIETIVLSRPRRAQCILLQPHAQSVSGPSEGCRKRLPGHHAWKGYRTFHLWWRQTFPAEIWNCKLTGHPLDSKSKVGPYLDHSICTVGVVEEKLPHWTCKHSLNSLTPCTVYGFH